MASKLYFETGETVSNIQNRLILSNVAVDKHSNEMSNTPLMQSICSKVIHSNEIKLNILSACTCPIIKIKLAVTRQFTLFKSK